MNVLFNVYVFNVWKYAQFECKKHVKQITTKKNSLHKKCQTNNKKKSF